MNERPASSNEDVPIPESDAVTDKSNEEVSLEELGRLYSVVPETSLETAAPNSAETTKLEDEGVDVSKSQIVESAEQSESLEFDKETNEAFANVLDSSNDLLDILDRREDSGHNNLAPNIRNYEAALVEIRNNPKLDDGLRTRLDTVAEALVDLGIPTNEREFNEDLNDLVTLRSALKTVGSDFLAFGVKLRDKYGTEASLHVDSLATIIDNIDSGEDRIKRRIQSVIDYLDR